MPTNAPTRPALRYHGGKWKLAKWIASYFPAHRRYIESFGGGGSVLLRKHRAYAEIYNEIDPEVVNVFTQIRNNRPELERVLRATPFARAEYELSFARSEDPIEQARRTMVRSFMGFGSNSLNRNIKSGFRSNSDRSGTTPAHDWMNLPDALTALEARLAGVVIENKGACEVMVQYDRDDALHYVDPPYRLSTRSATGRSHGYNYELANDDDQDIEAHTQLAKTLHGLEGCVVLSGYQNELYDDLFCDWQRIDKQAHADGARDRVESLWLSPKTSDALGGLFKKGGQP